MHLLYSAAVSATVLLRGRIGWLSVAAPPAGSDALLPDVIVCVSAGFFAFHLWALVHHRQDPVARLCLRALASRPLLATTRVLHALCGPSSFLGKLLACRPQHAWQTEQFSAETVHEQSPEKLRRAGELKLSSATIAPSDTAVPRRKCRLFLQSYLKTLHLTVLLCLFCAAAYKREHTGLLAACLVSEVHSVFQICGRMQVRRTR